MYKANYKQKVEFDSKGKKLIYSRLEAKFRFRREVTPKNRKDISKRIEKLATINEIPQEYFLKPELFSYSFHHLYRLFRLGFNISCFIRDDYSFNQMINLNKLNQYVLTGKREL